MYVDLTKVDKELRKRSCSFFVCRCADNHWRSEVFEVENAAQSELQERVKYKDFNMLSPITYYKRSHANVWSVDKAIVTYGKKHPFLMPHFIPFHARRRHTRKEDFGLLNFRS